MMHGRFSLNLYYGLSQLLEISMDNLVVFDMVSIMKVQVINTLSVILVDIEVSRIFD